MDKIILHQLMAVLGHEELRRVRKFLASPFHNTDP